MASRKKIIWHDYKTGKATRDEFEEYLKSLPDTDWKAYKLERLAREEPEKTTDESIRIEPPTTEASRLDGTTGNPNQNPNHNPL